MSSNQLFPSIWLGDFRSKKEFDSQAGKLGEVFAVLDQIDDRLLSSRHPVELKAYCVACATLTQMHFSWQFGSVGPQGTVNPAWTETCVCRQCGLNSRMRAVVDFVQRRLGAIENLRAYIAEKMTPSYPVFKKKFSTIQGSEYLGPNCRSGENQIKFPGKMVRHEDLTALSFPDASFDVAITQDVFEHIPDYKQAFSELNRVLTTGGQLVFTIPFFYHQDETIVRASLGEQGIVHHLPPEIHGNPVSDDGSLCFQNFGWDILRVIQESGFSDASASMYWGPWQGHMGFPFFVFSARK